MTARLLVGDVFDRMSELPDGAFDLILTSPPLEPFLALRSYLPADHPDKAKEIGSEATPAEFIDTMLALTAEWRRLLAPHGSIAIEIGDTYAGNNESGWERDRGEFRRETRSVMSAAGVLQGVQRARAGWPLDKSLCGIPHLYAWSLAYGRNLLTGQPSPAGRWRVRNVKPWIRSNPPVGALVDKERPATSYVVVACVARDRWFDLDAVRTAPTKTNHDGRMYTDPISRNDGGEGTERYTSEHPAGAPPLDWWHTVDATIDAVLDDRAGKPVANRRNAKGIDARPNETPSGQRDGNWSTLPIADTGVGAVGARGVHIRRALEAAGILQTVDALDISPKGYSGAHYAVWPPELVRLLVEEMCPRHVCLTCGQPRRRLTGEARYIGDDGQEVIPSRKGNWEWGGDFNGKSAKGGTSEAGHYRVQRDTLGWSDCGHNSWRPGHVLDPFAGSGTTLAVCTGLARDATGIDIDERNALLAQERVGMFLEVEQ